MPKRKTYVLSLKEIKNLKLMVSDFVFLAIIAQTQRALSRIYVAENQVLSKL